MVFLEHPVIGDTGGTVAMVDLQGRHTVLTRRFRHLVSLAFHPSGTEVWFSAAETGILSAVWAVNFKGEERLLMRAAGALRLMDVARDGRALVSQNTFQSGTLARPRGSKEEHDLSWFDFTRAVDLSADGQTLLFDETGEGGGARYSTFLRKLDGSPAVRLGEGSALALSPDGRWAMSVVPDKTPQMVLWPTGPGQPIVLPNHGLTYQCMGRFTPDSRPCCGAPAPKTGRPATTASRSKTAAASPEPILDEGIAVADISPDGQWLLGSARSEDGKHPVGERMALYPLSGRPPRPIMYSSGYMPDKSDWPLRFGSEGNSILVWHKAGNPRRHPTRIDEVDLITGQAKPVLELRPADLTGFALIQSITLTADAQVYAYSCVRAAADLYLVDGLV